MSVSEEYSADHVSAEFLAYRKVLHGSTTSAVTMTCLVKPLPADAHGPSAAHRCAAVDEHQREAALLTFLVWLLARIKQSVIHVVVFFGKRGIFCRPCFCRIPRLPKGTTWINYIRCHDDIGFRNVKAPLPLMLMVCRQRTLRCR